MRGRYKSSGLFVWNRSGGLEVLEKEEELWQASKNTNTHGMSLSIYQAESDFSVATVPTTLQTVPTPGHSIPFSEVSSILVQYEGEKKGGHGSSGGHGSGSGHGSSHGSGSGSKGDGSGNNGRPGHYYYNGRNYEYGYPVQYAGNRYYPRGVILPVAFGGAGGYLLAGHIYHTYSSSSTLYYSEVPTACGASGSSWMSTTSSVSGASPTCTPPGSSYSFTDGGGLVTIQQKDLASAEYSTLSDASTPPNSSSSSSFSSSSSSFSSTSTPSSETTTAIDDATSSSSASVSSISIPVRVDAASSNFVHGTGGHQKLAALFSAIVTTGLLISLM